MHKILSQHKPRNNLHYLFKMLDKFLILFTNYIPRTLFEINKDSYNHKFELYSNKQFSLLIEFYKFTIQSESARDRVINSIQPYNEILLCHKRNTNVLILTEKNVKRIRPYESNHVQNIAYDFISAKFKESAEVKTAE